MKKSLGLLAVLAVACGSAADPPNQAPSSASSQPPAPSDSQRSPAAPAVTGDGVTLIFEPTRDRPFNVMYLASDGTHLYAAGYTEVTENGNRPAVDATDPMKTATLVRVPVRGGTPEVVDYEHGEVAFEVAFDGDNVVWSTDHGPVFTRAKAGGPVTPLDVAGSDGATGLVSDGQGALFWGTWGALKAAPDKPLPALVARMPGASVATAIQETTSPDEAVRSLASDDARIYWMTSGDEIRSMPKSGAAPTTLATGLPKWSVELFVDATSLWNKTMDEIWSMPKTGGDRAVVARARTGHWLGDFRVTEDAIYWTELPLQGTTELSPIWTAARDGSNVHALTSAVFEDAHAITTDARAVYWATGPQGGANAVYTHAR